ncbi:hypothetical protein ARMGADRAFT_1011927 [Armillaria gallica]|uniref:Uncharacterized protein n=1 Tax=Armillaria gallica TaxID=47427 RepID=A0A2H3E434_ARMGA|nr:hypothetical protein ARMGADRAFT_1011927 [Armillaria gallica]
MTRIRRGQLTEFGIMADEIRVRSTVQRNESGRRVVQKQQQDFSSSITFLPYHHPRVQIAAYSPFDNDVYFKAKPRPLSRLHESVPQTRNTTKGTSPQGRNEPSALRGRPPRRCSAKRRLRIPPSICTPLALNGVLNQPPFSL